VSKALGDPLGTDAYALCVYDASENLLLQMTAPAGGTCGTKPCWKQLGPPILPTTLRTSPQGSDALPLPLTPSSRGDGPIDRSRERVDGGKRGI
jgi:hypothetical protein